MEAADEAADVAADVAEATPAEETATALALPDTLTLALPEPEKASTAMTWKLYELPKPC